jgi:uncharacterized protein (TIGR03086 family)
MTTDTAALSPVWRSVLAASYRGLTEVVGVVGEGQWQLATPCADWNVTQVIQHAAGDQLVWARSLGIGVGPGFDPMAPSGAIDGTATDLVRSAVDQVEAAWATVSDDAETVPTPFPHGDLPTPVAATMCALDAVVHAWDLAVTIGTPSPLDDELAGHLLATAPGLVDQMRNWGVYAAVIDAGPDDTTVDTLLRYLGRNPK